MPPLAHLLLLHGPPLCCVCAVCPLTSVPGRVLQEYAVRKMDGINLEGSRILVEFAKENAVRAGARGGSGYRLIAEGISARTSWQDLKVCKPGACSVVEMWYVLVTSQHDGCICGESLADTEEKGNTLLRPTQSTFLPSQVRAHTCADQH